MRNLQAAEAAVTAYVNTVRGEAEESLETQIADLLADLIHLADARDLDWHALHAKAWTYVDADDELLT